MDLSRDEIENLLDMENHSTRTFHRMESQWKRIIQKARSKEDTIVFPKLNDKIQSARLIIQQTHTSYQTYRPNRISQHRVDRRIIPTATPGIPGTKTWSSTSRESESSLRYKRENASLPGRTSAGAWMTTNRTICDAKPKML